MVRQTHLEWWMHGWKAAAVTFGAVVFLLVAVLNGMLATALGISHPMMALLVFTLAPIVYGLFFARRWQWPIITFAVIYLSAAVFITIATWGIGWVVAGELRGGGLILEDQTSAYDLEVLAISGDALTLRTTARTEDDNPWLADGLWGLEDESGAYHRIGYIKQSDDTQVEREIFSASDELKTGDFVRMDYWYFQGDPQSALEVPYQQVSYASPLGDTSAWLTEGTLATWVIFVHGKGSNLGQSLRVVQTTAELGMPTLVINYRNDPNAPASPDGYYHYSTTEWEDLDAAVNYALESGAQNVILIGYSMGGGVIASFLHNSTLANRVIGVVYDAPMLDFGTTVDFGGEQRGLPRLVIVLGKAVSRHRLGVEWTELNYLRYADELNVPILLIHGEADKRVPIETSEQFAQIRPDLVTYVRFEGAPHNGAWNVDPARYEQVLRRFLQHVVP